jgi:hypothetical protein
MSRWQVIVAPGDHEHDVRTQLCGGDERGKLKMTEMSKPAEMLYRAFLDELRFAKQLDIPSSAPAEEGGRGAAILL